MQKILITSILLSFSVSFFSCSLIKIEKNKGPLSLDSDIRELKCNCDGTCDREKGENSTNCSRFDNVCGNTDVQKMGDCVVEEDGYCESGRNANGEYVWEDIFSSPEDCPESCGDDRCEGDETNASCPDDCPLTCGDGMCGGIETHFTCASDCPQICGDGRCEGSEMDYEQIMLNETDYIYKRKCEEDCPDHCGFNGCEPLLGETNLNCPADCPVVCGDDRCEGNEDPRTCPGDCPQLCGDGRCEGTEDNQTCRQDCPSECGNGICEADETYHNCFADCKDNFADECSASGGTIFNTGEFDICRFEKDNCPANWLQYKNWAKYEAYTCGNPYSTVSLSSDDITYLASHWDSNHEKCGTATLTAKAGCTANAKLCGDNDFPKCSYTKPVDWLINGVITTAADGYYINNFQLGTKTSLTCGDCSGGTLFGVNHSYGGIYPERCYSLYLRYTYCSARRVEIGCY